MTDTTPVEATEAPVTDQAADVADIQVGDPVLYTLSDYDVQAINAADPVGNSRNPANAGQAYPAVVTARWSATCVNLHVILDGAGAGSDYWATSRQQGTDVNEWHA